MEYDEAKKILEKYSFDKRHMMDYGAYDDYKKYNVPEK